MKRSEIWQINLDPTTGAEIKKTRPVVIINDDSMGTLPLRVILPLTDWKNHYAVSPWMVKIEPDEYNNISKISSIDCFQIRSVSTTRFIRKIGEVDTTILTAIENAISLVLKL